MQTASEQVTTYVTSEDGAVIGKSKAHLMQNNTNSPSAASRGDDVIDGTFYGEKLDNTPLYNYVKLVVAEYNALLFRNPPQRTLPDSPEVNSFINDVDGEENSITEFMSLVDMYTTVFGVCHVGCYKPAGSDIPKWRIHTPLDITNWEYKYDIDGNLKLNKVAIKIDDSDVHEVYRLMTPDTIDTVFVAKEEEDYVPPQIEGLTQIDEGMFMVSQENELGYIPLKTFYQSTKVYNNVGTTVIQDVASIQRSIYGDLAEIYSAITYGSHPTLLVDETTSQLNDGAVGSEPGSIITVQAGLTGEPAFTYEFRAPDLGSIDKIKELIDSKIEKLSQIAMLRSEDLIKASRSGEQIEVYDDKLSALIRRKATNLENGEAKLWDIWFDWTNQNKPQDFGISYNRQYNKKALEHELNEINLTISVLEKYESMVGRAPSERFASEAEAIGRAQELGGDGAHSHVEDGETVYMPFNTHAEYESAIGFQKGSIDETFKADMLEKVKQRLEQLLGASSTTNSL